MKKYRFRNWLRNWINNFDSDSLEHAKGTLIATRDVDGLDYERALNFRVWFANGGRVIQTNRYDRVKDRNFTGLYVIGNDQDLGEEINKIITMEGLRG